MMLDMLLVSLLKIVDTRNRIIHGYDSVSDDVIWGILIRHIPILQTEIQQLFLKENLLKHPMRVLSGE